MVAFSDGQIDNHLRYLNEFYAELQFMTCRGCIPGLHCIWQKDTLVSDSRHVLRLSFCKAVFLDCTFLKYTFSVLVTESIFLFYFFVFI